MPIWQPDLSLTHKTLRVYQRLSKSYKYDMMCRYLTVIDKKQNQIKALKKPKNNYLTKKLNDSLKQEKDLDNLKA